MELAVVILAILSAYTLVSVFSATISGGPDGVFDVEHVVDPETGDWLFILNGQPRNGGFLDVTFGAKASILSLTNETLAVGESSTHVPPGGTGAFTVTLRLTREQLERYGLEQNQGAMEIELHVRTLMELVGFSIKLLVRGGE